MRRTCRKRQSGSWLVHSLSLSLCFSLWGLGKLTVNTQLVNTRLPFLRIFFAFILGDSDDQDETRCEQRPPPTLRILACVLVCSSVFVCERRRKPCTFPYTITHTERAICAFSYTYGANFSVGGASEKDFFPNITAHAVLCMLHLVYYIHFMPVSRVYARTSIYGTFLTRRRNK